VAWYDSNDVNKLATSIISNVETIENAIGDKFATLLINLSTSTFGFGFAYYRCWELSLVLTAMLPLLILAGALFMKALALSAQKGKISFEEAAGRA
jgi:ATP-binding cassette subfamily B (MDR/TAP) protein 1